MESGRDGAALGRVPLQKSSQEVQGVRRCPWHKNRERCGGVGGEGKLHSAGQTSPVKPRARGRSAQYTCDFVQLVHFAGPGKQRSKHVEFSHNSAAGEGVHGRVVVGRPKEDLWSPVPTGGHVVCVRRSIRRVCRGTGEVGLVRRKESK